MMRRYYVSYIGYRNGAMAEYADCILKEEIFDIRELQKEFKEKYNLDFVTFVFFKQLEEWEL